MEWNGIKWNRIESEWQCMNGMEWNGMEWNGMEWNGMEVEWWWCGMVVSGVEWMDGEVSVRVM